MGRVPAARLTMGPVLFNWTPEVWRDFYFRIADEAPVDTVHVGEVVCSKRAPFYDSLVPDVVSRLEAAGKEVVFSTLALIMNKREMGMVRDICSAGEYLVEANDISAAALLSGKPHVIGPYVNVYNEGTLSCLSDRGAIRVCLPVELDRSALDVLAQSTRLDLEVQVFGRLPLAVSARCYHARSHNLTKDSCQYLCAQDPDGMDVDTLDGEHFLAVNGVQTMSYGYGNLISEMRQMRDMGINRFRLWPHTIDMVKVARAFRGVLDGTVDAPTATERLGRLVDGAPFSNGYFYGKEGIAFTRPGTLFL